MVTDQQVGILRTWLEEEASLKFAAAKAGMDRKTARKYRQSGQVPSRLAEQRPARTWQTRPDPFAEVWSEVEALLERGSGWEAKTLFEELQRRYPGRFAAGQLRTRISITTRSAGRTHRPTWLGHTEDEMRREQGPRGSGNHAAVGRRYSALP